MGPYLLLLGGCQNYWHAIMCYRHSQLNMDTMTNLLTPAAHARAG